MQAAAADAEIDPKDITTPKISEFDWTKDEDYPDEAESKADFVLAADCVYHEELIPHLLRAVQAVVHKKSTGALRVCWLLCYVLGILCFTSLAAQPLCWCCAKPEKDHKELKAYLLRVMQGSRP